MTVEFVTAMRASSVQPGAVVAMDVRGMPIAVANVGGTSYAFDDTCTHERCSLAEGDLAGTTITSMCHRAAFDIQTGKVLAPPAPIRVYPIRIKGDWLLEIGV